ncbi:MAG: dimethylarginine dimethylaminohydrolase family protein [Candidatus Hodarchaeales archaeon]|jgi:N-dimethylarginine dimethylaminohydrolase
MIEYGCQSMIGTLHRVLIKTPKDAFISQEYVNKNWKKFGYKSCPNYEKALEEYSVFEEILKEHVPKINYLPYNENIGLDSIYTHDPVKIMKSGAIILSMGKESREKESQAMKDYLIKSNIPIIGSITGGGKVEGGDLLWLDEKTLAIGRGYRTNDEGIKQLRVLTASIVKKFIVVQLPHGDGPDACLHLMSLVSIIDENLAVVYSKFLSVKFREMLIKRGIQLLEVPEEEFNTLGSNVLTIAPRKCIMVAGNQKMKKLLENEGVEVFEYHGEEISIKGTGGPTCLTCPIVRE